MGWDRVLQLLSVITLSRPRLLAGNGNPPPILLDVDPSEAILAAVVFTILDALLFSTPRHNCRIPINTHFQVGDFSIVIVEVARFETGQNLAFGSQLTSLIDESVVIGSHSIQCGCVVFEERLVAFELDLFDLLLSGNFGICRSDRLRTSSVC